MDADTAKTITEAYDQSTRLINDTLHVAMKTMSEEEYKVYRRRVGAALWEVYVQVGKYVFDQFPELDPHVGQEEGVRGPEADEPPT